ncbi:MAG: hypothetical protein AAF251_00795 [Pseudomonadota bacterium]
MFRSHFVVLQEEPAAEALAKLKEGYQLWRESRTGLFYLTEYTKPLGKRPEFQGFFDWGERADIDVAHLESQLETPTGGVNLRRLEVGFDLIKGAASFSKRLGQKVIAAEDTDDEYSMAVMVEDGAIQYLRLRTTLAEPRTEDGEEEWPLVNLVYTPEAGYTVDKDPSSSFCAAAETAIEEVYGVPDLDLYNYTDSKPTRDQVKAYANPPKSISAYLDSFGVFKRLSHAEPQRTVREKVLLALRWIAFFPLLPFMIAGLFGSVLFFDKWTSQYLEKHDDLPFWFVLPVGAAILALPILILFWILRAIHKIAFLGP